MRNNVYIRDAGLANLPAYYWLTLLLPSPDWLAAGIMCRGARVTGPLRLPCEQVVTPVRRLPRGRTVTEHEHDLIDYASQ